MSSRRLVIVHIGAGSCREFSRYLKQSPDRVVLVEANASLSSRLQQLARYHHNLQVITKAVTPSGGITDFFLLNSPLESSALSPDGLLEMYPNLRVVEVRSLDAMTPAELLSQLQLVEDDRVHLVLEVQGLELQLMEAIPEDIWPCIEQIDLRSSAQKLFHDGCNIDEVCLYLENRYYRLSNEKKIAGSAFRHLYFERDQCAWLRHQLALSRSEQDQLRGELEQSRAALKQANQAWEQQARLAQEREQQLKAKEQQLAELRQQGEALQRSNQEFKVRLKELQDKNHQLEQQIQEANQRQYLMHEEIVRAEAQIDLIKDLLLREPDL